MEAIPFFFDSDSDGDLDIFVSAMAYYEDYIESATMSETAGFRSRAHLYRNEGNDQFVERAVPAGLGAHLAQWEPDTEMWTATVK